MTDTTRQSRSKSPKAFRTISEAAGELDLPQHVLRFWETKFPQIKPMKRAGGRRFYRPEDVELLTRIKTLLHTEGYTIKGVQKLLRQNGGVSTSSQTPSLGSPSVIQQETNNSASPSSRQLDERHTMMAAEINTTINSLESVRTGLLTAKKSS